MFSIASTYFLSFFFSLFSNFHIFSSHFLPSSSFSLFLHFRSLSLCFFLFFSLILLHFSFRCKIQNTQVRKQQRSVVIDAHVTLNSLINWRLKKMILDLDTKHIWKQKHFFRSTKYRMAGISFMDSSPSIRRYDLSRHDRKEIMLLIDPSVSPLSGNREDEPEEDKETWRVQNLKDLQV